MVLPGHGSQTDLSHYYNSRSKITWPYQGTFVGLSYDLHFPEFFANPSEYSLPWPWSCQGREDPWAPFKPFRLHITFERNTIKSRLVDIFGLFINFHIIMINTSRTLDPCLSWVSLFWYSVETQIGMLSKFHLLVQSVKKVNTPLTLKM